MTNSICHIVRTTIKIGPNLTSTGSLENTAFCWSNMKWNWTNTSPHMTYLIKSTEAGTCHNRESSSSHVISKERSLTSRVQRAQRMNRATRRPSIQATQNRHSHCSPLQFNLSFQWLRTPTPQSKIRFQSMLSTESRADLENGQVWDPRTALHFSRS